MSTARTFSPGETKLLAAAPPHVRTVERLLRDPGLPTRRNEAWKWSDLRAAFDENVQIAFGSGLDEAAADAAGSRGDVIAMLAELFGKSERVCVEAGADVVRIDRVSAIGNLNPTALALEIAPGARVTRIVIQPAGPVLGLNSARVRLAAGAKFRQFVLAEGAKLARIETFVSVEGEGAEVELNGVYLCGAGCHADLTSVIEHQVPNGRTRQLIKGVARKGGRGVFQGKIVVAHCAQKTDAQQYHHALLLEEGAEVFAKPELMIHADDVQCAHGNTAGGLDESALFYLRSRGVDQAQARALLIEAFLGEAVLEDLPEAVREELDGRIRTWLGGAA